MLRSSLLKRGTALDFSFQALNEAKSAFKVFVIEQFFGNFVAKPNLEQNLPRSLNAGKLPCNWHKARENTCKSSKTGFDFAPDWLKD